MIKTLFAAFALVLSFAAAAAAPAANPQVEVRTNMGSFTLELYPENAPNTVQNFLQYVKDGHYNGTIFHRVMPGFMIQGGGFDQKFEEKPTRPPIKNEAGNGLRNGVGMVSMARTKDPHSASAQFFINVAENPTLDFKAPTQEGYGYTPFGKVIKGMDVVERITAVPTGPGKPPHQDVPRKPVVIERIQLVGANPSK
ncbi:MAG: Peptidylprolyl isomerase [Betaproteobacteria bacterium]|jgi:peptidyl-prolyl cis-trans isomerase A (cyclophilin A)/peptidyl-prolyl cis-trans isomerase B (cyclophilin B)|nr:Peptidylprolyl isomerase [Betaproteobacteria bacterium]